MARPTGEKVSFLSFNSTGMNSVKSKWIGDLMDTCGASFCGVQEHFKKTKTLSRYFKSEFPNCDSYVEPAHREEGRDTGRAKGGLAQLSVKGLGVRQKRWTRGPWSSTSRRKGMASFSAGSTGLGDR